MLQERPDVTRTVLQELKTRARRSKGSTVLPSQRGRGLHRPGHREEVNKNAGLCPRGPGQHPQDARAAGRDDDRRRCFTGRCESLHTQESLETAERGHALHAALLRSSNQERCQGCHGSDHQVRAVVRVATSMEPVLAEVRRQRNRQILIAALTIVAAAGVLTRRHAPRGDPSDQPALGRPPGGWARATSRRARRWRRGTRSASSAPAFNEMTARLATGPPELEHKNTELATALQNLQESRAAPGAARAAQGRAVEVRAGGGQAAARAEPQRHRAGEAHRRGVGALPRHRRLHQALRAARAAAAQPARADLLLELSRADPAPARRRQRDGRRRADGHLPVRAQRDRPRAERHPGRLRHPAAHAAAERGVRRRLPGDRLHMGINTGEALVGATKMGGAGGPAVDLHRDRTDHQRRRPLRGLGRDAARSSSGPTTAERIRAQFVLESLGERSFKNVSQPIRVYPRHPARGLREDRLTCPRIGVGICVGRSGAHRGRAPSIPEKSMSAEARLRFYAERLRRGRGQRVVLRDPRRPTAARWVERTPPGFVFHVKAWSLMTGHHPRAGDAAGRRPGAPAAAAAADAARRDPGRRAVRPRASMRPSASSGPRSGPWRRPASSATCSSSSRRGCTSRTRWLEYLAALPARLPGWTLAVELRHRSWFPDHADETLRALRAAGLAHVIVTDAPAVAERHAARDGGDRADRGHAAARAQRRGLAAPAPRRGAGGAREVRLPLLRSRELAALLPELEAMAEESEEVFISFNNNNRDYPGPQRPDAQAPARAADARGFVSSADLFGLSIVTVWLLRRAADPAHRARAGADAAPEARAPVGRARPGAVDQARRLHRPARDRQQDPQARVPGRRRAGPGRRHPHHLRHAAVELLPGGRRGLGAAGAARRARPQGRPSRRVRRQPPARPAARRHHPLLHATPSGTRSTRCWRTWRPASARPVASPTSSRRAAPPRSARSATWPVARRSPSRFATARRTSTPS